jgi:hypothetical protein
VATLHDVQGYVIEVDAGATGHYGMLSDNSSLAPFATT